MRLNGLLLALLVATSAFASEPVTLTGRVLIQNNGPRTVLAFIESGNDGITHVLRLSAEQPFPQNPVSFTFERAHVEIEPNRFVITSAEERMSVILAVTPDETAPPSELPATPEHNAVRLHGYWLSSRTVAPGRSIVSVRRSPRIAALFCDATVSGDACDDMGGTDTPTSCTSG